MPECWILDETRRKFALMMQEVSSQGTYVCVSTSIHHVMPVHPLHPLTHPATPPHATTPTGKSEEEVKQMITKENFEKYRGIALPGTLKTLRLGVATARVAELEKLEVDQLDLQDQVRWL